MNCRQAQDLLFAARDETEGSSPPAELADHLASCPDCLRLQAGLTAAIDTWKKEAATVQVPDPQTEWHAVRRRLRQEVGAPRPLSAWVRLLRIAAPLTAVAAVALVIWQARSPTSSQDVDSTATSPLASTAVATAPATSHEAWPELEQHFAFTAHAEYVETDNEEASPFVYVDDESGWLIVWASDPPDGASI